MVYDAYEEIWEKTVMRVVTCGPDQYRDRAFNNAELAKIFSMLVVVIGSHSTRHKGQRSGTFIG
jgi:hypothetical protein